MRILLTGAFGNVGRAVLDELNSRNHEINILEIKNKKNKKYARLLKNIYTDLIWGDIRNKETIKKSINGCECVIHLAAVVPPASETDQQICNEINAEGTKNVLEIIRELDLQTSLVFSSSSSIMGPTQNREALVNTSDVLNPVTNYSKSKEKAEKYIVDSGINHFILRLSSVMDSSSDYSDDLLKVLFDFPLECRNEIIVDCDAALAIVNAAEILVHSEKINSKLFFIGGGKKNGCQITNGEMIKKMFEAMGIGMLSEDCFTKNKSLFSMDWYETEESNKILNYQLHSFEDYLDTLKKKTESGGVFVKYMAPKLKKAMQQQSPYFKKSSEEK